MFIFVTMPEGIGSLVNLETLICWECNKLESLPESKLVLFFLPTLYLVFSVPA